MEIKKGINEQLRDLMVNDSVREVMESFSIRERHRNPTNIQGLYDYLSSVGNKVKLNEINQLFSDLERLGVGKVVKGKFDWSYNLKDVGRMALGQTNILRPYKADRRSGRPMILQDRRPTLGELHKPGDIFIMMALKSGAQISLSLEELNRFSEQLKEIKAKLA